MSEHLDRLAGKFTDLNAEVSTKLRMKEALDQMVREGELGHDPETGEYWRLEDGGENKTKG